MARLFVVRSYRHHAQYYVQRVHAQVSRQKLTGNGHSFKIEVPSNQYRNSYYKDDRLIVVMWIPILVRWRLILNRTPVGIFNRKYRCGWRHGVRVGCSWCRFRTDNCTDGWCRWAMVYLSTAFIEWFVVVIFVYTGVNNVFLRIWSII